MVFLEKRYNGFVVHNFISEFCEVEPEEVDMPFGVISGVAVIFGVTGGVTEAVIRRVLDDKSTSTLRSLAFKGIRGIAEVALINVTLYK